MRSSGGGRVSAQFGHRHWSLECLFHQCIDLMAPLCSFFSHVRDQVEEVPSKLKSNMEVVKFADRSDSSGRDGHPFPSSLCFCSHQLHWPSLTKWAYLTPHPVAQMNNSPCRCTAGEAQAGLHLTERGQWIMGLRRGSPLPACPRKTTSNCSWDYHRGLQLPFLPKQKDIVRSCESQPPNHCELQQPLPLNRMNGWVEGINFFEAGCGGQRHSPEFIYVIPKQLPGLWPAGVTRRAWCAPRSIVLSQTRPAPRRIASSPRPRQSHDRKLATKELALHARNHPSIFPSICSLACSAEGLSPAGGVLSRADRTDEDDASLAALPTGGGSLVNQLLTSRDRTANITSCVSDTPWVANARPGGPPKPALYD
ncbi:hypothetical protein F2P79_009524 [Pimephales promelas]|nr:hypothetical protein F2P79_009524 [Pimephales promelas]